MSTSDRRGRLIVSFSIPSSKGVSVPTGITLNQIGVLFKRGLMARWRGAHVIGTASASNVDFVRSLGAAVVVDYNAVPFEAVIRDVDLVIDTVGGEVANRSLQVLRQGGTLVTIAARISPETAQARSVHAIS
jgi:D-arabinose 1-dehydrogenase-like Zn-dependent alcohol dehydrogenase